MDNWCISADDGSTVMTTGNNDDNDDDGDDHEDHDHHDNYDNYDVCIITNIFTSIIVVVVGMKITIKIIEEKKKTL